MIRSITICAALIASSGAGAVALSIMHDTAYVAAFPSDSLSLDAGTDAFVVPAFANASSSVDGNSPTLSKALVPTLEQPKKDRVIRTPESTREFVDGIERRVPGAVISTLRPVAKTASFQPTRSAALTLTSPRTQAPMVMSQVSRRVPQSVVRVSAVEPKYVIGVYR